MEETFASSLWSAITPPAPALPRLEGQHRVDVAVVGAGFLGLSLGLHLAEAGTRVAVVDREEPGFGASGRNTGFVVPSLPGTLAPHDLEPMLGKDRAERLARFVGGSATFLFDLVRRLELDCAAEQTGWIQPAHTPKTLTEIEKRVESWSRVGQPVRLLGSEDTFRLSGCCLYQGALLDRTGGQINPLAYARALAVAVGAAGGTVFSDSPVTTATMDGTRWKLTCPSGTLLAERVYFTTNAMVGDLLPRVRKSIIAANPHQVATQPLGEAIRKEILPGRQTLSDLHHATFVYRWTPDNRLVTGGLALVNGTGSHTRMAGYFLRRLKAFLPQLPELQPAYAWKGVVAATDNRLPQVWSVGPGAYAPIGCNGRGVALTTALGASLAAHANGAGDQILPVPTTDPSPKSLHTMLEFGVSAWAGWNRLRDWIDERRTST